MNKKLLYPFILLVAVFSLSLSFSSCEKECAHMHLTETVIAPTCEAEGKTVHKCIDCSYEFATDYVAPTGHTLSETIFAPTCEMEGHTYYSCNCGYSYKSHFIAPIGHTGSETVVPPTCSSEGYTAVACENCNQLYKKDIIPPISHNIDSVVIAPTHTERGYTQYDCLDCDFSYQGNFVAPGAHTFRTERIGATISAPGYLLHTCDCNYSYKSDYVYYDKIFNGTYQTNTQVLSQGLDISKWNHKTGATSSDFLPLDWEALKSAGFDFVILRVGSGNTKDPTFEMNYSGAKQAGFKVGVYYYTYANTVEETIEDALMVREWLYGKQLEFPVFYDMEDPSLMSLDKKLLTDMCIAFIETMQKSNYYCGLYSGNDWIYGQNDGSALLDTDRLVGYVDIWYARHYYTSQEVPVDEQFTWNTEKYNAQLCMWQYAGTGVIDGFGNTKFDFNYCYKDFETVIKSNHLNGF